MTTVEATFDGNRVGLYLNGHRLRVLWAVAALGWVAVGIHWRWGTW